MQDLSPIIAQTSDLLKKNQVSSYEIVLTQNSGVSTTVRLAALESLQQHLDQHISIGVYLGKKTAYVSGSDFSQQSLANMVAAAISIAKHTEADPFAGLAPKNRLAWQVPDLLLYHSTMPEVKTIIAQAKHCEASALEVAGISNSEGAECSSVRGQSYYANSSGLLLQQPYSYHSLSCHIVATDKQESQSAYDYHSAISFDQLDEAKKIGQSAAKQAVEKLGSQSLKSQSLPVIFTPRVSHSLFGHLLGAISGSNQYKKTSFLLDSIDKKVVPAWLDIIEKPQQIAKLGSKAYDSDGVLKQTQYFIQQGRVKQFVLGQYAANQLGLKTTACAGGLSNCYISTNSNHALEGLIKQMHTGVVITDLIGQGVNLATGNYSRGANGFFVHNSQIQYPISGITIAGNLKDMLQKIVAIGNDYDDRNGIKSGSTLIESMTISGQ